MSVISTSDFCKTCLTEKFSFRILEKIKNSDKKNSFPFLEQELNSMINNSWQSHSFFITIECVNHGRSQVRDEYFDSAFTCPKCKQEKRINNEIEKQRKEGKRFVFSSENKELTDGEIRWIFKKAGVIGDIYSVKPIFSYITDASYSIALITNMSIICYHITFIENEVLVSRDYKSDSKFWHLKKEIVFAQQLLDSLKPNAFKVVEVFRKNNRGQFNVKAQCNVCGRLYIYQYSYWANKINCPHQDNNRSSGEQIVFNFLTAKNVLFSEQETFKDLGALRFDFFIPERRILIEVNGAQHYQRVKLFHPEENDFLKQQKRDNKKRKFCDNQGYRLIELDLRTLKSKEDIENELNYRLFLEETGK